jgi:hypothetical protein
MSYYFEAISKEEKRSSTDDTDYTDFLEGSCDFDFFKKSVVLTKIGVIYAICG